MIGHDLGAVVFGLASAVSWGAGISAAGIGAALAAIALITR